MTQILLVAAEEILEIAEEVLILLNIIDGVLTI